MVRVLRYLSVVALLLMASCTQGRVEYPAEFALADSLAEHNEGQKALALLDSISSDSVQWTEPVQMRYALLRYKVKDKAFIPITTDSIILPILHYYEQTREEWLPEAYYYAGRTYTDLGDAPRALDYYRLAATEMEKDPERWTRGLARVYAQIGGMFSKMRLVNESIEYYHKSKNLLKVLKDTTSLINIYVCLSGEFHREDWDSVAYYNGLAKTLAEARNDTVWYLLQLRAEAEADVILGRFDEARSLIETYMQYPLTDKDWGIYSVAAHFYDSLGIDDSLEYSLKQMYELGHIYAQMKASGRLAELYTKQGKSDLAEFFLARYQALVDSADLVHNSEVLEEMQSTYNYDKSVRDAAESIKIAEQERARNKSFLLIIAIGVLLCGLLLLYIYRRRQHEENLTDEIVSLREERKTQASRLEQERARFAQTDVYRRIVETGKLTETDIREIEDFYRKNNPEFLESLTSLCNLSADELKVSLLIRMGFNQRQISDFMYRVPGTIQSIRQKIIHRVKGPGSKAEEWNRIIESL